MEDGGSVPADSPAWWNPPQEDEDGDDDGGVDVDGDDDDDDDGDDDDKYDDDDDDDRDHDDNKADVMILIKTMMTDDDPQARARAWAEEPRRRHEGCVERSPRPPSLRIRPGSSCRRGREPPRQWATARPAGGTGGEAVAARRRGLRGRILVCVGGW